ncbi:MAG: CRISPR-associated endonuclease Cas2 [Chlorobi bacterium]|nr:CRISPR-associated endonuclease Cas2 [Chlorobiota bacterium]
MKNLYLIAYDISKNKIRNKIADTLSQYGERINLSVFECMLTHVQINNLTEKLEEIIEKTDSIKIYFICSTCYSKSRILGRKEYPGETNIFID